MSLLPDRYDFVIWRGATFRTTLTLYTGDSTTSSPRDLSGYTADLIVKDKPEGTSLLDLTSSNGGIALGGVAGTIELFVSATDTTAITWKSGIYELSITAPSAGDTDVLLWGHLKTKGV